MSKRNSQEAKRAARERLQAERARQAKRDKVRRQVLVSVSVLGILAVAGGIGYGVMKMNEPTRWEAASDKKLVTPENAKGKYGTEVTLGGEKSKDTIEVYEDLRCPACASFEQSAGELLQKGADDGKYKLQLHLGGIIDNGLGGEGSRNAISALGSALNVSQDAFREYHEKLYSKEFHPQESEDKFADNSYLIDVANTVPELKNDKGFQKDVENGTFDRWTMEMLKDFDKGEIEGTPAFKVNGELVQQEQLPNKLAELGVKPEGAEKKDEKDKK
ncbi:thioredoxin domain-containing protein [Streptomyces sp. HNM0574]|uniref:thioredoxin domain-containing protein n=1 Tax=Streptomyces sp. HNM0574 TaxID=2714954 RepID=UPI00146A7A48|nr:thioredoxin domain-containing protein [Streptomyces sp. HNM0574]NLU67610.1 thioredoxin domain-containing protein [Streptomyces sp. HNM0574]